MPTIKEAVAEKIAASGPIVFERVVDKLTEETLAKRTSQILSAMTEVDNLNKEFYRMKPDVVSFNEDGSVASATYTKKILDDRKKNRDRLEKVSNAITKALETGDYSKLNELGNGKSSDTE